MSLGWKLAVRFVVALLAYGLVFFLSAGSLRYWQGWAFLVIMFIPGLWFGLYFYKHDPAMLRRRLQTKEKVKEQKVIMKAAIAVIYLSFLIPGLDYRFGWSKRWLEAVPPWLNIASLAGVLGTYFMIARVLDVNRYAASTIQVEAEQKVISTGPYKWVRHPFYSASIVMFLFAPMALGSFVALPFFALIAPMFVLRLLNEEKVLRSELAGYSEYCEATRYRLVPYVW